MNKFDLQDSQYSFPYHYIPHFDASGSGVIYQHLPWGYEYLCYLRHISCIVNDYNPSQLLDVGCGDGRLLGMVNANIKRVGVDLSSQAINLARALNPGIDFRNVSLTEVKERFDFITAIEVLEHIPDEGVFDFLRAIESHLVEGGYILLSVPTVNVPLNKKHYRHYNLNLLEDSLFKAGSAFKVEQVEYIYNDTIILKIVKRLMNNRLWFLSFRPLEKMIWRYVWEKLRYSTADSGRHLVVLLRKSGGRQYNHQTIKPESLAQTDRQ